MAKIFLMAKFSWSRFFRDSCYPGSCWYTSCPAFGQWVTIYHATIKHSNCYNYIMMCTVCLLNPSRSSSVEASEPHQVERWEWRDTEILPHGKCITQLARHRRTDWSFYASAEKHSYKASWWAPRVLPRCARSLAGESPSWLPHHMEGTHWTP